MVSTATSLRRNKGYSQPRAALTVVPMGKRGGSDDDTGKMDERVKAIIAHIDVMLDRRGWKRADLARALGIDAPQVSNILNGKQGLSIPRMMDIYRVLGAIMLVREGDPSAPVGIGTLNRAGRLMTQNNTKDLALPGYMLVGERRIGPYEPGMQVWVNAEREFVSGRWVLIEREDEHELMQCLEKEDGSRWLVAYTGDEVAYRPERHQILATAYGHFVPAAM